MPLSRLLIANRGEIAVRINRAARALGIETVQVLSAADRDTMAADLADRTLVIGPGPAGASYLRPDLIVHAALASGCDAVHPGYGFLSERAALADLCADNDVTFVGPPGSILTALGDKLEARSIADRVGVPRVPGTDKIGSAREAIDAAERIGFPVLMKAAAGGGGRGMFIARDASALKTSFDKASAEAKEAFGDGTLYMERFVENARHVEVQVMGDGTGHVVHFGERDCSVQRRYQKIIEEAPCTVMPERIKSALHQAAVDLVASVKYRNAGTVEFLYDLDREEFYFIEVNARIQVEHPVSEIVTGEDLVQWQLRIAGGEPLSLSQSDLAISGHAIECRINAEDPHKDFHPQPGRLTSWHLEHGSAVRLDSHCRPGAMVPPYYDSMLGKLIVHGSTRTEAAALMGSCLADFAIEGITTNRD
ncbi:MAG: biotin carboxylase N-terminal domain-containing protein, partial [Pseudomonadota bacterium]